VEAGQGLVRAGLRFAEAGQEFVKAGQQFVEDGQEFVRAGQQFVEVVQRLVRAGQHFVEAGQHVELVVQMTSTNNVCKICGMKIKKIMLHKHCLLLINKHREIKQLIVNG